MTTISRAAKFAERTSRLRASTIREMLKVTQQPDVISFGGGLPRPELFPTREIGECAREVMEEYGAAALQYSVTEGIPEMRAWVARAALERACTTSSTPRTSLIVNGSQQGLDLIGKIFLDPGDHVVLENPSYLGAIQAFDAYQARYLTVDTDEDGIIPGSLERVLERADPFPKFVYLVPNFQNPTGRTLAADRREAIVRICEHFGLPIVEDDPYGELRFEGDASSVACRPAKDRMRHLLRHRQQDHGARHAHRVARHPAITKFAKRSRSQSKAPICTAARSRNTSSTATRANAHAFEAHVGRIVPTYRARRDVMVEALEQRDAARRAFNCPAGGMFLVGDRSTASIRSSCSRSRRAKSRVRAGRQFLSGTRRPRRNAAEFFQRVRRKNPRRHLASGRRGAYIYELNLGRAQSVAACYVTGIASTEDISELEKLLGGVEGIDHSKLTVITTAERSDEHESSFLNFIHAGGAVIDSDLFGGLAGMDTGIITSSGGTGVPGISAASNSLGYLGTAPVAQHLGTLPIPEDEADNYNDALEDGRCVVAYDCTGTDGAPIEAALRNAGLRHVKTFIG